MVYAVYQKNNRILLHCKYWIMVKKIACYGKTPQDCITANVVVILFRYYRCHTCEFPVLNYNPNVNNEQLRVSQV